MGRAILGVIIGFFITIVFVFVLHTVAWLVLGAEGAFKPAVWDASNTWVIVSLIIGLIAGIMGGLTCKLIVLPRSKAPLALAFVILLLGLTSAVAHTAEPQPETVEPRPATITMSEAMTKAEPPMVSVWSNPFIGFIGVMLGASLARKKPSSTH